MIILAIVIITFEFSTSELTEHETESFCMSIKDIRYLIIRCGQEMKVLKLDLINMNRGTKSVNPN